MTIERADGRFSIIESRPGWHPITGAPPHIRAAVNRRRAASGLPAIPSPEDLIAAEERALRLLALADATPQGPGVWIDPKSRIAPRGVRPAANGYFRASDYAPPVTRVILACYGGTARRVEGRDLPERIVRGAFGAVATLNAEPGWMLKDRHDGSMLAVAVPGRPALRAVAIEPCLVVEWIPDLTRPDHVDAVRSVEAGTACSLCWTKAERLVRDGVELVTSARLLHVALEPKGAYPGALTRVFRDCPGNEAERRRQIRDTIAASNQAAAAAAA